MKLLAAFLAVTSVAISSDCTPPSLNATEKLSKFQELDRAAQSAFDRGDFVNAAARYREAVCLVPDSARALYGLGVAEAASGKLTEGRKALESAFNVLPTNPMPLAMLVRVDAGLKDLNRVKEDLRIAAERFPKNAELHSGLARFLAQNQLLDLALAESLRFEETGAGDASSLVALAALENTVGAYDDAIRNGHAIEEQATGPDAIKASAAGVTGLSYESIGDRDEAIKHVTRAIELAPTQENSYLALADLYEKAHRFPEAVDVLKRCRERISTSSNSLLPLGNNLVWSERYDEGIQVLNELIGKQPNSPEAYVRLAEAYRNTARPAFEVQALRQLARIKPDYPMVLVLTAKAMMTVEPVDYPGVLQVLTQAARSTPNDADIFYLRGKAYAATGKDQEAIAAYQRSIELGPMNPSPYYQLGLTYTKLGKTDLARQAFNRMQHVKQAPVEK
jgi:tetratricopeptide (TPR) repeat protein